MGHCPAARASPPVTLGVRRDERADLLRKIHVKALDGDVVGIPVRGLDLVQVEARREEQDRFAAGCHQGLIHVRRHAAGAGQHAERGRLEQGKVAVPPADLDHRLGVQRIPVRLDHRPIVDRPHFQLIGRIDKFVPLPVPRAVPEHLQRFIHAHHNSVSHPACEPLHFHLYITHGDILRGNICR